MAWVTKDSVEQYDHTPEPPKEYTKKEKVQNWWHYHKFIVLGVVVAILVVAWFIKDTVFHTRPDVQIGYIGQYDLPADTVTALQDALTPYCTDLNGDGKVVVQVNSYTVDFNAENDNSDAYNQMAGVTRLSADLSDSGTLYVMLIADPAGFQKSTGALAYLDGTPPELTIGKIWSTAGPIARCWPGWIWAIMTATRCWTMPPAAARACCPPCMWAAALCWMRNRPPTTPTARNCGRR